MPTLNKYVVIVTHDYNLLQGETIGPLTHEQVQIIINLRLGLPITILKLKSYEEVVKNGNSNP